MGERNKSRNVTLDLILYNVAASLIVIVGVFAFAYVGQQMSHSTSKLSIAVEAPRAMPWPFGTATSATQPGS